VFVYPRSMWRKMLWRLPLLLWRTGLAPVFGMAPVVVMTTRGRKSGAPRHVMTDCFSFDGKTYVIPGWGARTQWYQNVQADPDITAQLHGQTFAASAHRITDPHELSAAFHNVARWNPMWKKFLRSWEIENNVQDFLSKRDRIVVVRLDRTDSIPPLASLKMDLWWVWPAVAILWLLFRNRER
jgi:deazaflavin-dependent oxidoreductase (nitroreductase family)